MFKSVGVSCRTAQLNPVTDRKVRAELRVGEDNRLASAQMARER